MDLMKNSSSGKSCGALRTIGEASAELGVKSHILRYWEEQFPMLRPLKRAGARRYYRSEDMALLARIDDLLNRQGYTVKGAVKFLKSSGEMPQDFPSSRSAAPAALDADKIHKLQDIRAVLAEALAAA